jgi:hypothetical protein
LQPQGAGCAQLLQLFGWLQVLHEFGWLQVLHEFGWLHVLHEFGWLQPPHELQAVSVNTNAVARTAAKRRRIDASWLWNPPERRTPPSVPP